jgi:DNA-binding NarL/FixJ family response regulator
MRHRILIADDEEVSRKGLKTLLSGWDYAVEEAANGQEALEKAAAFLPEVVIRTGWIGSNVAAVPARRVWRSRRYPPSQRVNLTSSRCKFYIPVCWAIRHGFLNSALDSETRPKKSEISRVGSLAPADLAWILRVSVRKHVC